MHIEKPVDKRDVDFLLELFVFENRIDVADILKKPREEFSVVFEPFFDTFEDFIHSLGDFRGLSYLNT